MRVLVAAPVISWFLLAVACSSGGGGINDAIEELAEDVSAVDALDTRGDDLRGDTAQIPEGLQMGVAVVEAPAPLGISTAGYSQSTEPTWPDSPLVDFMSATQKRQTPINTKAAYLKFKDQELLVLKLDRIGVPQETHDEFIRRLNAATGGDWEDKAILAANHTHLGPARLWEHFMGEFANDLFWPQYYDRYMNHLVETAQAAIAAVEPVTVSYGVTDCPECHNDRRCENEPLLDSTLWVVEFRRLDQSIKAVWVNFAIHGTVLAWQDLTLSGDAPGMIERKLEERFDHPVDVFLFQSWGGDVSPANPTIDGEENRNTDIPDNYSRMERIGHAAADHIMETLDSMTPVDDPELKSTTLRFPFYADIMGYEEGEWPHMEGSLLCGDGQDAPCWGEEGPELDMTVCLPMVAGMIHHQAVMSAFAIGPLLFVTCPGEPVTTWTLEARDLAKQFSGFENVLMVGYSQDHWGYLLKEYDFLLGGYEPSIGAWGPLQGEFLLKQIEPLMGKLLDPEFVLPWEPLSPLPTAPGTDHMYYAVDSESDEAIVQQPASEAGPGETVVLSWNGGDPWLGTPTVRVEQKVGDEWTPVSRACGRPFSSDSHLMEMQLTPIPDYHQGDDKMARTFQWTVRIPVMRNVPSPDRLPVGTLRLVLEGNIQRDENRTYQLVSDAFEVVE